MVEYLDAIDKHFLIWIHQHFSNSIFDLVMPFITDANNWTFPILALIVSLGFKCGKRGKITLVLLIIGLSVTDSICAQILKPFFERVRPSYLDLGGLNLLVSKGGKWSMPSNHAANIFTFSVILGYFYEKIKIPLFSLAFLIAFSRVYVGVHYPGDVIVGFFIGYFIGWVLLTLWIILKMRELKRRRTWIWYEGDPPVFNT